MDGDDRLHAMALAATARWSSLARAGLAMLGPGGAAAVPSPTSARPQLCVPESGAIAQRSASPARKDVAGAARATTGAPSSVAPVVPAARPALRLPPDAHGSMRAARGAWPAPRPLPAGVAGMADPARAAPELSAPVAFPGRSWAVGVSAAEGHAAAAPLPALAPALAAQSAVPAAAAVTPPSRPTPPSESGTAEPDEGEAAPLDEARLAHWLGVHLDEAARRPPRGGTGFDPRLSPGWPGTLQGPWGWGG